MTALPLPPWLRDREPAVAYFPRQDPALAEAWPVLDWRRTDTTVTARTETGEIRFRLWDGGWNPSQMGANPAHAAILVPASDPRAVAAADRTRVMRAVHALTGAIRANRPGPTMSTDAILNAVANLGTAVAAACEEIEAVVAVRS